jgi:hypothetical protein
MARNLKLIALVAVPAIGLGALFFVLRGGGRGEDGVAAAPGVTPAVPTSSTRPAEPTPAPAPLRNPDEAQATSTPQAPATPRAELEVETPPPTTPLEDAMAWLARVLPAQFASLTPEQALALEALDLRGAVIADADLQHLRAFPRLTSLGLRGTAVTDAGLPSLGALQQLKDLDLRGTKITGFALGSLPWKLEALHLTSTGVKGTDLFVLTSMPNLATLKLNSLAVDDAALDTVAECSALRHLELDNTQITDAGLRSLLGKNPHITRIELRSTGVSRECLKEMAERYPTCELVSETLAPGLQGETGG